MVSAEVSSYVARARPTAPVYLFHPDRLIAAYRRFERGFPGLVTYAVKSNPAPEVVETLLAAGMAAFDVASPTEIRDLRARSATVALHYNNPVRLPAEVAIGVEAGVASWAVDRASELEKLAGLRPGTEVSVRFKLDVAGAAYDFGSKLGASAEEAVALLARVAALGLTPALMFHPGTQCETAEPWERYIAVAAEIAEAAGVGIARLNLGGGFPAHRAIAAPDLDTLLARLVAAVRAGFGAEAPALVCEPGRALVAEAMTLVLQVKSVSAAAVTLSDGLHGGLAECRDLSVVERVTVLDGQGQPRAGRGRPRIVFGPTCDSVDRLPEPMALPDDLAEGDWVIFEGMGAYAQALSTGFNGYGTRTVVPLAAAAAPE